MEKSLVIVESPAKAKTINKFLGSAYEVVSSMGHIVDLPKSKLGIDVENDFKPEYVVMAERKKNLTALKKQLKDKSQVYLASDPDSPPYVKVGDHVGPDTTVCIVEAMKVFNEIPAEVSGKIVAMLIQNGDPVEFGQPMFKVDPRQ